MRLIAVKEGGETQDREMKTSGQQKLEQSRDTNQFNVTQHHTDNLFGLQISLIHTLILLLHYIFQLFMTHVRSHGLVS